MEHNVVKSPKHYTAGRKFEPKDVIRDWKLNFNLGSALKYIARAGRKGDPVEDLEKAREYLAFEIEALKAESGKSSKVAEEKCTFNPLFEEKAIEVSVPEGMPLDEAIKQVISKIEEDLE